MKWDNLFPTITRLDSIPEVNTTKKDSTTRYRLSWNKFFPDIAQVKPKSRRGDTTKAPQIKSGQTTVIDDKPEEQPQRSLMTVTLFWKVPEDKKKLKRSKADEEVIFKYFTKKLRLDTLKNELVIRHYINENPFEKAKGQTN